MLAADWFYLRQVQRQPTAVVEGMKVYDKARLAKYDGSDETKPIYLALDGYVYDVSPGRSDFYGVGQPYHDLAGKDDSVMLHMFGGELIKRKYKVVGVYQP